MYCLWIWKPLPKIMKIIWLLQKILQEWLCHDQNLTSKPPKINWRSTYLLLVNIQTDRLSLACLGVSSWECLAKRTCFFIIQASWEFHQIFATATIKKLSYSKYNSCSLKNLSKYKYATKFNIKATNNIWRKNYLLFVNIQYIMHTDFHPQIIIKNASDPWKHSWVDYPLAPCLWCLISKVNFYEHCHQLFPNP